MWSDGVCDYCREGLTTDAASDDHLLSALLTLSDVMGTGHHAALGAGGARGPPSRSSGTGPSASAARLDPSPVFDMTVGLEAVPDGYKAMDETALKVLVTN